MTAFEPSVGEDMKQSCGLNSNRGKVTIMMQWDMHTGQLSTLQFKILNSDLAVFSKTQYYTAGGNVNIDSSEI